MRQYSVLLVDDEPTILRGMAETYDWDGVGFYVLDTAVSGEQALEKVQKNRPDVIMADIRMKNMDGLTLIRQVQSFADEIEFIVVSAFKDFEYAKTACKLGAFSYLTKPFSDDEFSGCMTSLKIYLDQKREEKKKLELYHRYSGEMVRQQLKSFLLDGVEVESIRENLAQLHSRITDKAYYCCICVDTIAFEKHNLQNGLNEKLAHFGILKEAFSEKASFVALHLPKNRLLFIVYMQTDGALVYDAFREVLAGVNARGYHFIASGGHVFQGFGGMKQSFDECIEGIELAYEYEADQLIVYRSSQKKLISNYLYPKSSELDILNAIKLGNYAQVECKITAFHKTLESLHAGHPFEQSCYQLLCLNIKFLLLQLYDVAESDLGAINQFMEGLSTLHRRHFSQTLCGVVQATIQNYDTRAARRTGEWNQYVEEAMRYTKEHMGKAALSIVDVAEHLHLNAVYFGRLFKKDIGIAYREYLLNARMEQAKMLLLSGEDSITKISLDVGMSSSSYFAQQFKGYTGMLPSEFRKGV